jgi:hypothetical protein
VQTLHRLTLIEMETPTPPEPLPQPTVGTEVPIDAAAGSPRSEPIGAIDKVPGSVLARNVKAVFICWILVFGLVGAQMSWILRPFIGNPDQPFAWFRDRESNFFEAVVRTIGRLFS